MAYTLSPYPFPKHPSRESYEAAREYCARFVAGIPDRIQVLSDLVRTSPAHRTWQPDLTMDSLKSLGVWLKDHVSVRAMTEKELREIDPVYPSPMDLRGETITEETISVMIDVAMYLGQTFVSTFPGTIKWGRPVKGKRSADYSLPYLDGFGRVTLNPIRMVMAQIGGVANNTGTWRWDEVIEIWRKRAQGDP